ncbi:hypothetical protein BSU04_02390 [Caballeronia sordidicola]|uniref:Uncharacterized protein n=1 Tax=Caballeronia sordidicola TaxID=196367 RepID=A0A226XA57_CABSO|nr:hypothetical protein BSU04_02390 [Caballeronia sordidicola]
MRLRNHCRGHPGRRRCPDHHRGKQLPCTRAPPRIPTQHCPVPRLMCLSSRVYRRAFIIKNNCYSFF